MLVTVFLTGVLIGLLIGWKSAFNAVMPKIIKAFDLMSEAGIINESKVNDEKLKEIFDEVVN